MTKVATSRERINQLARSKSWSIYQNLFQLVSISQLQWITLRYPDIILTFSILETPKGGSLANSEDLDEMPQNAAFHQGLHCLLI